MTSVGTFDTALQDDGPVLVGPPPIDDSVALTMEIYAKATMQLLQPNEVDGRGD
jgi:hypothetical protein